LTVFASVGTGLASSQSAGKSVDAGLTLAECVETIRFFEIVGGVQREVLVEACDLADGRPLTSSGYISGVVVSSTKDDLQVSIEDTENPRLNAGGDPSGARRQLTVNRDEAGGIEGRHCYVYFPNVPGDAVLEPDRFQITISDGQQSVCVPVRHRGYREISPVDMELPTTKRKIRFDYAGEDASVPSPASVERQLRLQAVAAGIDHVEQALGAELVAQVTILDWKGADNALTSSGNARIWLYADTFRNRSAAELKCAAEHEALHVFVDRQGYTKNTRLRELFADLKGFGPLSLDRFALVTTGKLPPAAQDITTDADLLTFIDERNFIDGMAGGHASENLDEFATSFLHSLLYIDRLASNLDGLDRVDPREAAEISAETRRRTTLEDYRRTLEAFLAATGSDPRSTREPVAPVLRLLERGLALSAEIPPTVDPEVAREF